MAKRNTLVASPEQEMQPWRTTQQFSSVKSLRLLSKVELFHREGMVNQGLAVRRRKAFGCKKKKAESRAVRFERGLWSKRSNERQPRERNLQQQSPGSQ